MNKKTKWIENMSLRETLVGLLCFVAYKPQKHTP